jgi:two-component sensor histidine kinase
LNGLYKIQAQEYVMTGLTVLDELYYRVNNEFTAAISVLSIAAARTSSDEVKTALSKVSELLRHCADVHRTLQMPEDDRLIDAGENLSQLCLSISRSKLDAKHIKLLLFVETLRLPATRCWCLGMIVYELITNAARHAFDGASGEIRVAICCDRASVKFSVRDNGTAPPIIRPGRGLQIVDMLSNALGGQFKQTFGPWGSEFILIFPRTRKPTPIAGSACGAAGAKLEKRRTKLRPRFEHFGVS